MVKIKKRISTIFYILRFSSIILFLSSFVFLPSSLVYSAVPHLINYQGRLTDTSGVPLNGLYNITFRIYDAENAGNLLWQGTYSSVSISKGVFSILLGDVNDSGFNFTALAFDKPYWLEIKVGEDVLTPRQRIASVGYAITAENGVPRGVIVMWSGTIANIPSGWALCDGTNGTPDLRDKFIVGVRQDDSGIAKTNVSGVLTKTGGEAMHVLTIDEMPAHSHTYNEPTFYSRYDGHSSPLCTGTQVGNTNNVGGGKPHNNLPPYYALAYIIKL